MNKAAPTQKVTAITLPRWLEIADRRSGSSTGRHLHHYVVSPNLNADDAGLIAETLTRHERTRRQAQAYRDYAGYVLMTGVLLIVTFALLRMHLLLPIAVGLGVLLFERFGVEVTNKSRAPVNLEALQDLTTATLFHPISPNEYYRATRYARRSSEHAKNIHTAMWRAYELGALADAAQDEYASLSSQVDENSEEAQAFNDKVQALRQAADEAHDKLLGLLDPNRQSYEQAATTLAELSASIEEALAQFHDTDQDEPAVTNDEPHDNQVAGEPEEQPRQN